MRKESEVNELKKYYPEVKILTSLEELKNIITGDDIQINYGENCDSFKKYPARVIDVNSIKIVVNTRYHCTGWNTKTFEEVHFFTQNGEHSGYPCRNWSLVHQQ